MKVLIEGKHMSETCNTICIVDKAAPDGFVVINESDYIKSQHEIFNPANQKPAKDLSEKPTKKADR